MFRGLPSDWPAPTRQQVGARLRKETDTPSLLQNFQAQGEQRLNTHI